MTVRLAASGLALACGAALAQPPAVPTPATPVPVLPPTAPPAAVAPDWSAVVRPGTARTADLPKALAEARVALAAARDYTTTLVRQERVNGALLPEQTCSLAVRTTPAAVRLAITAPKGLAGTTTIYIPDRSGSMVKHRAAGPDGTRPTKTLPSDDPAVLAAARHPVTGYGLAAVLDRVEGVVQTQKLQHRPTEVLASEISLAGKPATRFEVFADRPTADGPRRLVLCLDAATKLPVRYEAYGAATPASPGGELLEAVGFSGTKLNVGLGDAVFER